MKLYVKETRIISAELPLIIEKVLLRHSSVNNCAVVPFQTGNEEEQAPCAFIVLKNGIVETDELRTDIIDYCNNNLDYIYQPKKFIFIQRFPLTKVGKIDYQLLEKMASTSERNES